MGQGFFKTCNAMLCCVIYDSRDIVVTMEMAWVVADGLAPIWRQDICNNHDDIDQSAYKERRKDLQI